VKPSSPTVASRPTSAERRQTWDTNHQVMSLVRVLRNVPGLYDILRDPLPTPGSLESATCGEFENQVPDNKGLIG